MEKFKLKYLIDNIFELSEKFSNHFVYNGLIYKKKYQRRNMGPGIEIERFKLFLELIKKIQDCFKFHEDDEIIFEYSFMMIKTTQWFSKYNHNYNIDRVNVNNSILDLIINFQKEFKCELRFTIEDRFFVIKILPYFEIHEIFYKVSDVQELKEIKSFANEHNFEIIFNEDEKEIIEKNPHLAQYFTWDNFLFKDVLFYSRLYKSDFGADSADSYRIKKDRCINLNLLNRKEFPLRINFIILKDLFDWKKFVLEDYKYCTNLDNEARNDIIARRNRNDDNFDYRKYAEESTYEALGIELPDDFDYDFI